MSKYDVTIELFGRTINVKSVPAVCKEDAEAKILKLAKSKVFVVSSQLSKPPSGENIFETFFKHFNK